MEDTLMSKYLTKKKLQKILLNPFYCITIDKTFSISHEPIITEDTWIKSQVSLIKEIGEEKYFKLLLDVLKGGYVK